MASPPRSLYHCCFLLVIGLALSHGVVVDETVRTSSRYLRITRFGFLKNGEVDVSIVDRESNSTELWFLSCDDEDWSDLFGFGRPNPCSAVDEESCMIAEKFQGELQLKYKVEEYGMHTFELLNCRDRTIDLAVKLVALNPNGEHLGFDDIPLPKLYIVLTFLWVILTGAWCFNWIKHRTQKIKLHTVISVYPVVKLLFAIAAIMYWENASNSGIYHLGFTLTYGFLYIAFKAAFYTILLFVASGWGICNDKLGSRLYVIIAVVGFLLGSLLLAFLLHGLFYLLSFILYIVIIVIIFRFTNANLRELEIVMRNNPDTEGREASAVSPSETNDRTPVHSTAKDKLKMLKSFKFIMLSYIALVMLVSLLEILFLINYFWVVELLREMMEMMMFMCIGWTFRLRDRNIYYQIDDDDMDESVPTRESARATEMGTVQGESD